MQTTVPDLKQLRTRIFYLPDGEGVEGLLKILSKAFTVEESFSEAEQRTYYDTFDWRLHRANQVFYRSGSTLQLQTFSGRDEARHTGRKRSKYFWWDIGQGRLRELLKPAIEMRALSPVVEVSTATTQYRVMNKDRKTVAKLGVRSDQLKDQQTDLPEQVTIHEVRGYEREFETIVQGCLRKGCVQIKNKKNLQRLLKSSGRTPRDYGDKFRVELDPEIGIGEAISKICLHLVNDMEVNLGGVVADVDSEFLHDFRIAVRRTRSLLSLMKKILPPDQRVYFQAEFRWLGSVTGPLRDIDVYLLEKEDYLGLLPPSLQDGMSAFFDQLQARRVTELKNLQTHLQSERFKQLLKDWRFFLEDPASPLFEESRGERCRDCAERMIFKRFKTFLREGDKIDGTSPDDQLHNLRIRGKKFRYLLEFFKTFYDEEQMTSFLRYMKKLQDNLGEFNDLSVQQDMLGTELNQLRARNLQTIRFAAALGGLIAMLAEKHKKVRGEFEATYTTFAQPQVRKLLETMVKE